MSNTPVIIIVDQYAHNATVQYGDEGFSFVLPHMYGADLGKSVERCFFHCVGCRLDMDAAPYKAVGDLRYYHGVAFSD